MKMDRESQEFCVGVNESEAREVPDGWKLSIIIWDGWCVCVWGVR